MILITSELGGHKTFRMMPIHKDCPYVEVIFEPLMKALVVVGKDKKETFRMIPMLDKTGNYVQKQKKLSPGENPYREERKLVELWQEYTISERSEIDAFIAHFGLNATNFGYEKFFQDPSLKPSVAKEPALA